MQTGRMPGVGRAYFAGPRSVARL